MLQLEEKGYKAAAIRGGMYAWRDAGHPLVEKGRSF